MDRKRTKARATWRLLSAIAFVLACAVMTPALAEIPTGAMTADGAPSAPPPKSNAPRTEHRTSEQRPAAAPSLG